MILAGQPEGHGATDLFSASLPRGESLSATGWKPIRNAAGELVPPAERGLCRAQPCAVQPGAGLLKTGNFGTAGMRVSELDVAVTVSLCGISTSPAGLPSARRLWCWASRDRGPHTATKRIPGSYPIRGPKQFETSPLPMTRLQRLIEAVLRPLKRLSFDAVERAKGPNKIGTSAL